MKCQRITYTYPDGTLQRVAVARPESWEKLNFRSLSYEEPALSGFGDIYQNYLIPACPWIFGNLVLLRLPEAVELPDLPMECGHLGRVADRLTALCYRLKRGAYIQNGKPVFLEERLAGIWKELEKRDCIRIVRGKLPTTQFIPVGTLGGYLSAQPGKLKVNASFFIMDPFDCATEFDHVGQPVGLRVRDGVVESPPLFGREALLIFEDGVRIEAPSLESLELSIGLQRYRHGENARFFSRPEYLFTPGGNGKRLVIVGDRVEAVVNGGAVTVPASGFVMCAGGDCNVCPGDKVIYHGMEAVCFGIQVGNSILRKGEKTLSFRSRFYNIRALQPVPYPPCLYPLDFDNARAARIALGADREGKPVILWAEGAPKLGYVPGVHSRGATLKDMASLCQKAGMFDAVNLDGGGSAQMLFGNRRLLSVSDRSALDGSEQERAIPLALTIDL